MSEIPHICFKSSALCGAVSFGSSCNIGYLKSYGDKIPPIQKRMGGYFHDNDVLV
jgi:hypothetical protein